MAAGADLFATMVVYFFFFFFFQAEDGIRDKLVTGVQTCALPISDGAAHGVRRRDPRSRRRRSVLPGRALRRAARGYHRLVRFGGVPRQARTGAGRSYTARRDSGVRAAAARPRRDVGVELRPQVRAAQLAQSRSRAVGLDHPDGQRRPGQEQPVREASRAAQALNKGVPAAYGWRLALVISRSASCDTPFALPGLASQRGGMPASPSRAPSRAPAREALVSVSPPASTRKINASSSDGRCIAHQNAISTQWSTKPYSPGTAIGRSLSCSQGTRRMASISGRGAAPSTRCSTSSTK